MSLEKECDIAEYGYWVSSNEKYFKRNVFTSESDMNKVIPSNIKEGIFKTVYKYNSVDIDEAIAIGDLYFDFDSINDFELARKDAIKVLAYLKIIFKIDYDECNIYFSGNKGIHITVPYNILNIKPNKDIHLTFKCIAKNALNYTAHKTLDMQIYDKKRLFRVVNTKHEKSGLYKIQLSYDELKNLEYNNILVIAKSQRRIKYKITKENSFASKMYCEFEKKAIEVKNSSNNIHSEGTLNYMPPCIKNILDTGAKEGLRNNSIAVLSSFYKSSGKDYKTSVALIKEWNSKMNNPAVLVSEIERTVLSIYSSNKAFGCSKIKTLAECNEQDCRLIKNKKGSL